MQQTPSASMISAQQLGSVFGIAVLGVIVTSRSATVAPSQQAGAGPLAARAFVDGMQAGLRVSAVHLAVGAFLALAFLPSLRRSAPAVASTRERLAVQS